MAEMLSTIIINKKCISCGTCISLCPHKALEMKDEIPSVTGKCKVCGLCASSCITKAISMGAKKFSDEGIIEGFGKVVVFACRRKAESGTISLLCAARFDPYLAAEAYFRGAEAVAVVACEECRNLYGNFEARNKVWMLNEILKLLGEKSRVIYSNSVKDALEKLVRAEVKNKEILKLVTLDRNLRAIIANMRRATEVGNSFGEKIEKEKYENLVRDFIRKAVNVARLKSVVKGKRLKISEIVNHGICHKEVIDAVLELKKRGEVKIDVEDELIVEVI